MPTEDLAIDFFGRDNPTNPAFSDAEAGRRMGVGGALVPGNLKLAWLVQFVNDWAGTEGSVLSLRAVFRRHPLGITQTAYAPAHATALGIDLDARPSFVEVMTVRADRMALVRGIVDGLTDTELARTCTRTPAPGYPEESRPVGECLSVVMEEECEHHRFVVRDLAVLEAR